MKKIVDSRTKFLNFLEEHKRGIKKRILQYERRAHGKGYKLNETKYAIANRTISNVEIRDINLDIDFINCTFKNCDFSKIDFQAISFEKCFFDKCEFFNVRFWECELKNIKFHVSLFVLCSFYDSYFSNLHFANCQDLHDLNFLNCNFSKVSFTDSEISEAKFDMLYSKKVFQVSFEGSELNKTTFINSNLRNLKIRNCKLNQLMLINSSLSQTTIDKSNQIPNKTFSSIDFQTIARSQEIKPEVLSSCFGINELRLKKYISSITKKVEFNSIFISYSFYDQKFARMLNDALCAYNIKTFLWEKDAPGGKKLKKIMKEHIRKFDRILFIASENSIKSEACQFELSEGRQKQNKAWKETLFPIHVDNYLFDVEKEDIRPKKVADEFWDNIEELREIHSLDFSEFNKKSISNENFSSAVTKLIESLKLN